MVPNKDRWPGGEMLLAFNNVKVYTGCIPHDPLEAARGGPLRHPSVADQAQDN